MKYSFTCYGHENIRAEHKSTLEFTRDRDLSLKGDCIVGIKADFSLLQLKNFIKKTNKNNNKVTIIIETMGNINNKKNINKNNNKIIETVNAEINPGFNSDRDIVIRKSDFRDERTFAVKADKAAFELSRDLIELLKFDNKIIVTVKDLE